MDDALRSRLHDLALYARHLLTDETRSLLAAVYGLSPDGRFEPIAKLPAVQSMPEVAETRKRLERHIREDAASGRTGNEAVERLVRETAFTHLNRLVAFKLLEARKIIRGTLDRYHTSNGFLFFVSDSPEDEIRYQAGDMPQDALGEGPRDVAYRHFLLWQSAQLAREVPVLFDASNLASRLFPRPRVLRELLDALNAPELRDAWAAGNEETIGWVYQYFNEEEKAAVFERLNKQKQKIRREDLPAATQLFTPRWIVRFLVENTLGRHWVQMHPDSRLAAELEYLVPLAGEIPSVPLKLVRELTVLDHACGTMHFGLVAFDLLSAMYHEEIEYAGKPGWHSEPSVVSPEHIPAAILRNNIYGIDIDLRAVQLATLCLYIRAKSVNPRAIVEPHNFACADISLLNDKHLDKFIDTLDYDPALQKAMYYLWPLLKRAGEFGSLLRLERDFRDYFVPPSMKKQVNGTASMPIVEEVEPGWFYPLGDLDRHLRSALNEFVRHETTHHPEAKDFYIGTMQGLKLLELLRRRYDVVVCNPPYLDSRNYDNRLRGYPRIYNFRHQEAKSPNIPCDAFGASGSTKITILR
jgi:SAM-dependent methyltransferase